MHISKEEYNKLAAELEERIAKRPLLSERISNAIQKDMRVNDQLDRETRTYEQNEERIKKLEEILTEAEVNKEQQELEEVIVGAKITLKKGENTTELQILEATSPAINPLEGRISSTTKVAQALLGKKLNEVVKIDVPSGAYSVKVVKILY